MSKMPQPAREEISLQLAVMIVLGIVIAFALTCIIILFVAGYFDQARQ